jgi:hypothetical protein
MSEAKKKTFATWAKGLLAALVGGAVSVLLDPHSLVNDPKGAAKVAAGGAVIALIAYLKQSPISSVLDEEEHDSISN